jgi:hypothetical protein
MIRKKCKHDKLETRNKSNIFKCVKCKCTIDIDKWLDAREALKKNLEFVSTFSFVPKIKGEFYHAL